MWFLMLNLVSKDINVFLHEWYPIPYKNTVDVSFVFKKLGSDA